MCIKKKKRIPGTEDCVYSGIAYLSFVTRFYFEHMPDKVFAGKNSATNLFGL